MATFNIVLLLLSFAVVLLAAWSIGLARGDAALKRTRVGAWLFVGCLLLIGCIAIVAALTHADALAPLGILSGFLVVGMLWDSPEPTLQHRPERGL